MALPSFPNLINVPGDGNLFAIHGGGSTEVIGGQILRLTVVESYPDAAAVWPAPRGILSESEAPNGATIWVSGALMIGPHGVPTDHDWAVMLARWTDVRAKFLLADYELFTYYHPGAPATYRKYKLLNTVTLKSYWSNPVTLSYILAAVTADRTLYTTAPGI